MPCKNNLQILGVDYKALRVQNLALLKEPLPSWHFHGSSLQKPIGLKHVRHAGLTS